MEPGYKEFGRLLNGTGRPMVYACSYPVYFREGMLEPNYEILKDTCNTWRNFGDVEDSWPVIQELTREYAADQERLTSIAGPGHWNDMDMVCQFTQPLLLFDYLILILCS